MSCGESDIDRILQEEAAFSDKAYDARRNDLDLSPLLFEKYFNPKKYYTYEAGFGRLLGDVRGKALLDLGCGVGQEAVFFAQQGAIVTAIDISPVGIEITQRRACHNKISVDARLMGCPTTLPDSSYDIVHGIGIIHHIGVEETLREASRLLRPGGKAVFFEPMGNSRIVEAVKNWLRPRISKRFGLEDVTEHETVLRWSELVKCQNDFREFTLYPFYLLLRVRKFFPRSLWNAFQVADYWALRIAPPLRYFAGEVLIYAVK